MSTASVGVLSFQGDVREHILALTSAAKELKKDLAVVEVRTSADLEGLSGLIIPGGESTTIEKLCVREGMMSGIKKIPNIFGTCAGAIFLAKDAEGKASGQETLGLMDIHVDRNAYGTQNDSFEEDIQTTLGSVHAIFIRAPRIMSVGKGVTVLAGTSSNILACEEKTSNRYYLATSFHPELSTTLFHKHFLKNVR